MGLIGHSIHLTAEMAASPHPQAILNHADARDAAIIENWLISPYTPTPTIIEAARALYQNHSVEDITRREANKVSTYRESKRSEWTPSRIAGLTENRPLVAFQLSRWQRIRGNRPISLPP